MALSRNETNNNSASFEGQFIELRELHRRTGNPTMNELSVDQIGTPAAGMTSFDDNMSGLASFTNYSALEGEPQTSPI